MGFWNWIFGKTQSARCQFPDWVCGKKDFSILLWANFADGKDENSHARLLVVQDESTTSDRSSGSAYENLSKALVSKTHLIRNCSKWAFFADGSGLGFYFEDPVNGPVCLHSRVLLAREQTYHLGVVRSGSVFRFYVDGIEVGFVDCALEIPQVNAGPTNAYFTGKIGAPHFFVFAVTPAEIQCVARDSMMPGYPLPLFLWDGSPAYVITQKQPLAFWNDQFSGLYACVSREKGIIGRIPIEENSVEIALAQFNKGVAALQKGEYDLAINAFSQAIMDDPQNIGSYFNRGWAFLRKGELDKAVTDYSEVIRLDPQNGQAYCNRGSAYGKLGLIDKSIADFTEAIKLNPEDTIAYFGLGHSHQDQGELDKAVLNYTEAIRLDPTNEQAYCNRGSSYARLGELDRSIVDFTKAIALNPKDALAFYGLGHSHVKKGDLDKGFAQFSLAIELDSSLEPVFAELALEYANRALSHAEKGESDRALADYEQSIRLDPRNAVTISNRGCLHARNGEYDKAIADHTAAIRLAPKDAINYFNRSLAYKQIKEDDRASADYNQAVRLDPQIDQQLR